MYSYVVRKKVNKSGSEEEIRYHGIPVTSGQIGVSQMAEVISERCSLTHADVEASVLHWAKSCKSSYPKVTPCISKASAYSRFRPAVKVSAPRKNALHQK